MPHFIIFLHKCLQLKKYHWNFYLYYALIYPCLLVLYVQSCPHFIHNPVDNVDNSHIFSLLFQFFTLFFTYNVIHFYFICILNLYVVVLIFFHQYIVSLKQLSTKYSHFIHINIVDIVDNFNFYTQIAHLL